MKANQDAAKLSSARALHVEFRLEFLIERGEVRQPRADRRLNALEAVIAKLARPWRADRQVIPNAELRMSEDTLGAYVGWVHEQALPDERTVRRLEAYLPSVDKSVPSGWVRLLLEARSSEKTWGT